MNESDFYLRLSKEALANSRLWLEEANHLLFERQSYGHSLSLSLLSVEETMKSWICFIVGIGAMKHTENVVKEMFWRHPSKMETVVFLWIFWNIPIVQKSLLEELNEQEEEQFKDIMTTIFPLYRKTVNELVEFRKRGMYVDRSKGKIISPKIITRREAEGSFIDALSLNNFIEMILNRYENISEDKKQDFVNKAKRSAQFGLYNWGRIIKEEI